MAVTYPTKVMLAFRSGGVCAFPGCHAFLTYEAEQGDDTHVGEAAHIRGEKPKAARYDPAMTDDERDYIDNLIYMCGLHHTTIDKAEKDWPVGKLVELKERHESKVRSTIEEAFAEVAFPELELAMAWVALQDPADHAGGFAIISPDEKIRKNELSNGARHIIAAGLTSRATVAAYVTSETKIDPDFPDKLRAGFLAQYYKLRHQGHKGDVLFEMMCAFAQRGAKLQPERTAGLAVLIYLFELCDVFEK